MTTAESQVTRLLDQLPNSEPQRDPNGPVCPFQTSLVLTREQEDGMVQHALQYLASLEEQTGRSVAQGDGTIWGGGDSLGADALKALRLDAPGQRLFFTKRRRYFQDFYNEVSYRAQKGTIYAESNCTASISQRTVMQMQGRMKKLFFETDPWFSAVTARPAGSVDAADEAKQITNYTRWKLGPQGCDLKKTLLDAIDLSFILGEAVVKTLYHEKVSSYWRNGPLYVAGNGVPLFDSQGKYIFADAVWIDEMVEVQDVPDQPPVLTPTGRKILRRDNRIVLPPDARVEMRRVEIIETVDAGPSAETVHYQDFLCGPTEADVQTAPFLCHFYDESALQVANQMLRGKFTNVPNMQERAERTNKLIDTLHQIQQGQQQYMSGKRGPELAFQEGGSRPGPDNGQLEIAECWFTYDPDGKGSREIFLKLDRRNKIPLYYDYMQNVVQNGKRPFRVVRAMAVKNRWFGYGGMEYLEPEQNFIDLQVNRWNEAMSEAGSVTFWNPTMVLEGVNNPNLVLNAGSTYTLNTAVQDITKEVLTRIYLSSKERNQSLVESIQFWLQLCQLKSGVINVSDEGVQEMNATDTATGIHNLERSGQELFQSWIQEEQAGLNGVLMDTVTVALQNLNRVEVYRYSENQQTKLGEMHPEDARDVAIQVEMVLTSRDNERVLQSYAMAEQFIDRYFMRPLVIQQKMCPMITDTLERLGVQDAEKVTEPTDSTMNGTPPAMPGMMPGAAPALPPSSPSGMKQASGRVVPQAPQPPEAAQPMMPDIL